MRDKIEVDFFTTKENHMAKMTAMIQMLIGAMVALGHKSLVEDIEKLVWRRPTPTASVPDKEGEG